jgi:hypothetical protein
MLRFARPRSSLRIFPARGIPSRCISSIPPCFRQGLSLFSASHKASSRRARVFTSGPRDLAWAESRIAPLPDPSLRLKSGYARDDEVVEPSWRNLDCTATSFPVSQSRGSSSCYPIVVREAKNRQLLHFFLASSGALATFGFGATTTEAAPTLPDFRRVGNTDAGIGLADNIVAFPWTSSGDGDE